jgi:hypothetical protein
MLRSDRPEARRSEHENIQRALARAGEISEMSTTRASSWGSTFASLLLAQGAPITARELAHRAEPDVVVVAPVEERRSRGREECRHVEAVYLRPLRAI